MAANSPSLRPPSCAATGAAPPRSFAPPPEAPRAAAAASPPSPRRATPPQEPWRPSRAAPSPLPAPLPSPTSVARREPPARVAFRPPPHLLSQTPSPRPRAARHSFSDCPSASAAASPLLRPSSPPSSPRARATRHSFSECRAVTDASPPLLPSSPRPRAARHSFSNCPTAAEASSPPPPSSPPSSPRPRASRPSFSEPAAASAPRPTSAPSSPRPRAGFPACASHLWGAPPKAIDSTAPNAPPPHHPADLAPFLDAFAAEWAAEASREAAGYRSGLVFVEHRLRQALLLTVRLGLPNRGRTAAVCECFHRLCGALAQYEGTLGVVRAELLRSVYEEYDGGGGEATVGALLRRKTYFDRCAELREAVREGEAEREALRGEVARLSRRAEEQQALLREQAEELEALQSEVESERADHRLLMESVQADGAAPRVNKGRGVASQLVELRRELGEARKKITELSRGLADPPAVQIVKLYDKLAVRQRYQVVSSLLNDHGGAEALLGQHTPHTGAQLLVNVLRQAMEPLEMSNCLAAELIRTSAAEDRKGILRAIGSELETSERVDIFTVELGEDLEKVGKGSLRQAEVEETGAELFRQLVEAFPPEIRHGALARGLAQLAAADLEGGLENMLSPSAENTPAVIAQKLQGFVSVLCDVNVASELRPELKHNLASSIIKSMDAADKDEWLVSLLLETQHENVESLPATLLSKLARPQQLALVQILLGCLPHLSGVVRDSLLRDALEALEPTHLAAFAAALMNVPTLKSSVCSILDPTLVHNSRPSFRRRSTSGQLPLPISKQPTPQSQVPEEGKAAEADEGRVAALVAEIESLREQLRQQTNHGRRRLNSMRALSSSSSRLMDEVVAPMPLPDLLEAIAAMYAACIHADLLSDRLSRARAPFRKFFRDYHLRKHGVRSVADRAALELRSSVAFYATARAGVPLERARMFHDLTKAFTSSAPAPRQEHPLPLASLSSGRDDPRPSPPEERRIAFFLAALSALIPAAEVERRLAEMDVRVPLRPAAKQAVCRVVVDAAARQRVLARLEELAPSPPLASLDARLEEDEGEDGEGQQGASVSVDDALHLLMDEWDGETARAAYEEEAAASKMFAKYDLNVDGVIDYAEFGNMISSMSKGDLPSEEQLVDLFDEALKASEEYEDVDAITPAGFVIVARRLKLLPPRAPCFIDPIAIAAMRRSDNATESATSKLPARMASRGTSRKLRTKAQSLQVQSTYSAPAVLESRPRAVAKSEAQVQVLLSVVRDNFLFRGLEAETLLKVVHALQRMEVREGQELMRQGAKADFFYIAEQGTFEVYQLAEGADDMELVHIYQADGTQGHYPSFGELALLYANPRKATVIAGSDGVVWALDRAGFRTAHSRRGASHDVYKVLRELPVFSSLEVAQLQAVRDAMEEVRFAAGQLVCRQGEPGDSFYIIISGTVSVQATRPGEREAQELAQLTHPSYFGESALVDSSPRSADIKALTPLSLMAIDREKFETLLGPLRDIIDQDRKQVRLEASKRMAALEEEGLKHLTRATLGIEACVLEEGMQQYFLARHNSTRREYTLVVEAKASILRRETAGRTRDRFALMNSLRRERIEAQSAGVRGLHLLPELIHSFADECNVYQLLRARVACTLSHPGELDAQLHHAASRTFTVGCIALGLAELHKRGVLYRGLGGVCAAVDARGYVVLSNLAWARRLRDGEGAETLCGEPDFMAPEVVRASGHGTAADWWALGIRLYWMFAATSPWSVGMGLHQNEISIFQAITAHEHGSIRLRGPRSVVGVAQDLCNALLHPNPLQRLAHDDNLDPLFAHKFFEHLDVAAVHAGTLPSPLLDGATRQIDALLESTDAKDEAINTQPCPEELRLADGEADRFAEIFIH